MLGKKRALFGTAARQAAPNRSKNTHHANLGLEGWIGGTRQPGVWGLPAPPFGALIGGNKDHGEVNRESALKRRDTELTKLKTSISISYKNALVTLCVQMFGWSSSTRFRDCWRKLDGPDGIGRLGRDGPGTGQTGRGKPDGVGRGKPDGATGLDGPDGTGQDGGDGARRDRTGQGGHTHMMDVTGPTGRNILERDGTGRDGQNMTSTGPGVRGREIHSGGLPGPLGPPSHLTPPPGQ